MVDGVDLLEEDEQQSSKAENGSSDEDDSEWVTESHDNDSESDDGEDTWSSDDENDGGDDDDDDDVSDNAAESDQRLDEATVRPKRRRETSDTKSLDSKRLRKSSEGESEAEAIPEEVGSSPSEGIPEEKKSLRIDALRILGPEDFERIAYLKLRAAVGGTNQKFKNKKVKFNHNVPSSSNQEIVTPEDIQAGISKRRMTKEERLASVADGREGREKFGRQKKELGSKTNKEKQKKLPFALKKHSRKYREKKNQALHHKRKAITKHIRHSKSYSARNK